MTLLIQDGDEVFQADLTKASCSCRNLLCKHLAYAQLVASQSKASLFIWMSALHKAIRRRRLNEAHHFGGLLAARYGSLVVQRYIIKIFFEESREIDQFLRLGKSWWEDVAILCTAKKKFERAELFPQVPRKAQAYIEALKTPTPPDRMDQLLTYRNFHSALADIWRIRMAKPSKSRKRQLAKDFHRHLEETSLSAKAFMKMDFYVPGYLWIATLEEFYQLQVPVLLPLVSKVDEPTLGETLLQPGDFVYDQHTFRGLALMKRYWKDIGPGKPMPPGLDLRFSGSVMSCFWRECAFLQHGIAFADAQWEDVYIEAGDWDLSIKLDSHYYSKFHAKYSPHVLLSHLIPDDEAIGDRES